MKSSRERLEKKKKNDPSQINVISIKRTSPRRRVAAGQEKAVTARGMGGGIVKKILATGDGAGISILPAAAAHVYLS